MFLKGADAYRHPLPYLDHEKMPEHSMAAAEKWAAGLSVPGYALDDQTAIQVVDGAVEVVSEGHWKLFTHEYPAAQRFRPRWLAACG